MVSVFACNVIALIIAYMMLDDELTVRHDMHWRTGALVMALVGHILAYSFRRRKITIPLSCSNADVTFTVQQI
jgi:hypothetical protein